MTYTQDLLDNLAPMLYAEADTGDALTTFLGALGLPFELVETWASDTDTDIGWSLLVDVDRAPVEALPWLAQIVGLQLPQGLTEAAQRQLIRDTPNWKRGTVGAMAGAPAPYLTGNKTVILRERYDGSSNDAPYYMQIITYASETPDPVASEAAIRAQKPAGIILTYTVAAGQDLQQLKNNYATLQLVKDHYATLAGIKADQPV